MDDDLLLILIVEDDETDREALRRVISPLNAKIDEAATGEEALNLVAQNDYHCILLDHMLPDQDSIQLIPLIREKEVKPHTPIIVVTGYGNELLAVKMIKSGANDYIPKDKITAELMLKSIKSAVCEGEVVAPAPNIALAHIETLKDITKAAMARTEEIAHDLPSPTSNDL